VCFVRRSLRYGATGFTPAIYNLVHDRELTRLRAELDARQGPPQLSGFD
jgi:hypothetical protein